MTKGEIGVSYFSEKGMMCSQAVLAAFRKECNLTEKDALILGTCFASGMGIGSMCGACTGALMVISMLFGQTEFNDSDTRRNAQRIAKRFLDDFKKENGSYICNELLGEDITTEEGVMACREKGLFKDFCPLMVKSACDILERIIEDELEI